MQDVRLAFRNLWRRPAFFAIAIVTLALGLGANIAVFTVFNAILLSPLPYTHPNDVVVLNEQTPQFPTLSTNIPTSCRGRRCIRPMVGHRRAGLPGQTRDEYVSQRGF